ncbi:hypothetical protein CCR75_005972 [Bremia lactucae]|uniref:Ribophorin II n=1 Tax=Bremia lactucae TaxID=4779 RepID=A0A976FHP5_BRELC|nr:hypothetical protein CCR75_005972 [Bremia lactucae]
MITSARLLVACGAVLMSLSVDAALDVAMKLVTSRVPLTADSQELAIVVTPKQPDLKYLMVESLVDTSGTAVLSDLTLNGDGSTFMTKLEGDQKLQAGMYKLKVSAVNEKTKKTANAVLQLKVTTPVEVASVKINDKKLKSGDKLTGKKFNAAAADALKIEVKLQQLHENNPISAHQAFLRFTHVSEKTETYFVLTTNADLVHSTTLQFVALSKKFGYNSGKHHVQLILGAAIFEKAIVWDLGEIDLQLGAAPPKQVSPLYKKPLLHESDTTLKALPEIQHVMRTQDPRPPVAVSVASTGAVLAPLVFFVVFVSRLGLNVKRLFESSVLVLGCVFLTSLAGIFTLFGLYWLKLTMFRTLGYLSILGTVNLWSGLLTLKRLAKAPVKKTTKIE